MGNPVKGIISWAIGLGTLALVILVIAILFGNLSGNVGFATGTAGYNNTQNIIGNYTQSGENTASQFPVTGTILGVALLLLLLIGVLVFAIKKLSQASGGSSKGDGGSFG